MQALQAPVPPNAELTPSAVLEQAGLSPLPPTSAFDQEAIPVDPRHPEMSMVSVDSTSDTMDMTAALGCAAWPSPVGVSTALMHSTPDEMAITTTAVHDAPTTWACLSGLSMTLLHSTCYETATTALDKTMTGFGLPARFSWPSLLEGVAMMEFGRQFGSVVSAGGCIGVVVRTGAYRLSVICVATGMVKERWIIPAAVELSSSAGHVKVTLPHHMQAFAVRGSDIFIVPTGFTLNYLAITQYVIPFRNLRNCDAVQAVVGT